jgi:hypothetical protein
MALGASGAAKFEEAKEHILRGIEIADELKLKSLTPVGYFHLGELNVSSGQTAEAMEHLQTAELMFSRMGMDYWLSKTLDALAKL